MLNCSIPSMSRAADEELVRKVLQDSKTVLLELLRATAAVGESFVRSGMLVNDEALPERLPLVIEKLDGSISSIRYFSSRLDEDAARAEIRQRVTHLETARDELCRRLKLHSTLIIFPEPSSSVPAAVKVLPQRAFWRKATVHVMQKAAS